MAQDTPLIPLWGGAIFALGILGLVTCGLLGIAAWLMGNTDIREMDAGRMDPSGSDLTQAGKICGLAPPPSSPSSSPSDSCSSPCSGESASTSIEGTRAPPPSFRRGPSGKGREKRRDAGRIERERGPYPARQGGPPRP